MSLKKQELQKQKREGNRATQALTDVDNSEDGKGCLHTHLTLANVENSEEEKSEKFGNNSVTTGVETEMGKIVWIMASTSCSNLESAGAFNSLACNDGNLSKAGPYETTSYSSLGSTTNAIRSTIKLLQSTIFHSSDGGNNDTLRAQPYEETFYSNYEHVLATA